MWLAGERASTPAKLSLDCSAVEDYASGTSSEIHANKAVHSVRNTRRAVIIRKKFHWRCSVGLLLIEHVFVAPAATHREDTCALHHHTDPTPDWQITTILGTDLVLKFSSAQATTGLGAAVS